mmetsp:Transcript_9848/g.24943  ORF Transcript_9848/g.24943 Transcript_9848/m.24943 type:complete len:247 (+) Transcript_9848:948-1688(+)
MPHIHTAASLSPPRDSMHDVRQPRASKSLRMLSRPSGLGSTPFVPSARRRKMARWSHGCGGTFSERGTPILRRRSSSTSLAQPNSTLPMRSRRKPQRRAKSSSSSLSQCFVLTPPRLNTPFAMPSAAALGVIGFSRRASTSRWRMYSAASVLGATTSRAAPGTSLLATSCMMAVWWLVSGDSSTFAHTPKCARGYTPRSVGLARSSTPHCTCVHPFEPTSACIISTSFGLMSTAMTRSNAGARLCK